MAINTFVFEKITDLKPDILLLAANWSLYDGIRDKWDTSNYDKLKATLDQLTLVGIPHIYIIGNLPTFTIGQPRVANTVFVAGQINRTFYRFDIRSRMANEQIEQFAKSNNISFVSPIDLLCNPSGCLVSVSQTELIPLAFDTGHLTEVGASLLIELAIQKRMLSLP